MLCVCACVAGWGGNATFAPASRIRRNRNANSKTGRNGTKSPESLAADTTRGIELGGRPVKATAVQCDVTCACQLWRIFSAVHEAVQNYCTLHGNSITTAAGHKTKLNNNRDTTALSCAFHLLFAFGSGVSWITSGTGGRVTWCLIDAWPPLSKAIFRLEIGSKQLTKKKQSRWEVNPSM